VFKGKNTVNTETLEALGIKEGDFMVVMVTVKKPEPPKEAPKPVEIPKISAPVPNVSVPPSVVPGTTGVAPVTGGIGTVPSTGGESNLVVGEQYEASIQNLMGMGFGREEVLEALRAAYNNPERAVEYLINGIPKAPTGPALVPGQQPGQQGQPGTTAPTGNLDPSMLATLINSPQFTQIRQMIRNDPQSLSVFLQQIAQTSPQLFELISQNP